MTGRTAKALGLDDFDLHARYMPGLQALLPIPVTTLALGLNEMPIVTLLASLALAVGLPRTLVQFVRGRGLALEPKLWAAWGGKPTTQMLRLSDTSTSRLDKDRWRRCLSSAAKVTLPATAAVEAADPAEADASYEQVVAHARESARDDELLRRENQGYNYERNLLALQVLACVLAVLGVVLLAGALVYRLDSDQAIGPMSIGLAANALVLAGWIALPSERRARRMAEKYATRLFTIMVHRTTQ